MKSKVMGRRAIKIADGIVSYVVLSVIVLSIAFAGYALWDSNQIHQAADKSNYAAYKPAAIDEGKSFRELQALNAEVFAWLSVYGTNIDYPVTQAQDNMKYVNTNAEGLYSLSGSIFLDCSNSKHFSDFNSILYGHHMAKKVMFGEIERFSDRAVFDSHRYGNLYFDGKDHGIEFFAFVHTDAYDGTVFTPNVQGGDRQAYLDGLLAKAINKRDIEITIEDRIILLSTCSSDSTNGRDILVGRITDETYDDPTINTTTSGGKKQTGPDDQCCTVKPIPIWTVLLALLLAIRLIVYIPATYHRWRQHKKRQEPESEILWIGHER